MTACIAQRPRFAWAYLLRGQTFTQLKAFADAEADFATALELDPNDLVRHTVYTSRGEMWYQRGNLHQAAADLQLAIRLRPGEAQAHVTLAQTYRRQEKYREAQYELSSALQISPEDPAIYRTRAYFFLERKDPGAALLDFDRAVKFERSVNVALLADDHVERGRIRYQQGRYLDAVQAYDAALSVRAAFARAHQLRGEALTEAEPLQGSGTGVRQNH